MAATPTKPTTPPTPAPTLLTGGNTATAPQSNTAKYVLIGVSVVSCLVGLALLFKKKK